MLIVICRHLLALALACLACKVSAQADRPPIEDFFSNPAFSGAVLSPTGSHLAVRLVGADGRDQLAVIDLASKAITELAHFTDADIGPFEWISDERLVYSVGDRQRASGERRHGPGLFAINRDGSAHRQLAARGGNVLRSSKLLPPNTRMVRQSGPQDSPFIYVTIAKLDRNGAVDHLALFHLDTLSGDLTAVAGPPKVREWMLDHQGVPRLAISDDKNLHTVYYLNPVSARWTILLQVERYLEDPRLFLPMQFGPDGTLYVQANRGKDKSAIYTLDPITGKIGDQPLIDIAGFDVSGHFISNRETLLGFDYVADAEALTWFDPAMQAMQKDIDALLPHTVNLVSVAVRAAAPVVLVRAYSDLQPDSYLIYNGRTHTLTRVGQTRANIVPSQMGSMEMVHYRARDGLDIPAYVTHPAKDGKALPMVVLVHGGPYEHGSSWGWNPESQFLASRGYLVLEPAFRGTTGYGNRHYRAGWKQWGLAMQHDIADGVKWAVAQGLADPARVCIAGASYGGYATLMGLLNDPQLYQCGIDWLGVTDLTLLHDGHWWYDTDMTEEYREHGMPLLVGDPVKDEEQFTATSPLKQAERISQPLLLAYGGRDLRVPIIHGTKFYRAVKERNKQVEWVEYPEEGHGWALPKTRYDFWSRVEKFLDKQIGPGRAATAHTD